MPIGKVPLRFLSGPKTTLKSVAPDKSNSRPQLSKPRLVKKVKING